MTNKVTRVDFSRGEILDDCGQSNDIGSDFFTMAWNLSNQSRSNLFNLELSEKDVNDFLQEAIEQDELSSQMLSVGSIIAALQIRGKEIAQKTQGAFTKSTAATYMETIKDYPDDKLIELIKDSTESEWMKRPTFYQTLIRVALERCEREE